MAGEYLEFTNNTTPALSAPNMNLMQQRIKEDIHGTVLYENINGTIGDVTLNDSAENYKYIEVFAHRVDLCFSQKILNPNGKKFSLYHEYYADNNIYIYVQPNSINGNSVTRGTSALSYYTDGGYIHVDVESPSITYIDKVVGYK